jgi:hypothetical protein
VADFVEEILLSAVSGEACHREVGCTVEQRQDSALISVYDRARQPRQRGIPGHWLNSIDHLQAHRLLSRAAVRFTANLSEATVTPVGMLRQRDLRGAEPQSHYAGN